MRAERTTRRIATLAPLAGLALVTACTKGTDISAETPRPAVAVHGQPLPTLPAVPHATAEARRPSELDDPPGDFHLAAIVYSESGAGRTDGLVDFGDRLVVLDDVPVGQAMGDGPIVASRALRRGLPKDPTHSMLVHGAGGGPKGSWLVYGRRATRGSAPDGAAYRFDGSAWQKSSRYAFDQQHGMPWLTGFFAWNDGGAAVVESNMVSLTKGSDESTAVVKVYWFDAAKRSATKPLPMFLSQSAASPDGHVWLAGTRDEHEGAWVAHAEPSGKVTWEVLPGTETCAMQGLSTHGMSAREGASVALQIEYNAGDCEGLAGVHGFVRDANGWRRTGTRPAGSELVAYDAQGRTWCTERGSLVTRDAEGKVVTRQRMPSVARKDPEKEDSPLVQTVDARKYDADGTNSATDDGCDGGQLLVRKNGDRWLVRSCGTGSGYVTAIFRERIEQPVLVIKPEEPG